MTYDFGDAWRTRGEDGRSHVLIDPNADELLSLCGATLLVRHPGADTLTRSGSPACRRCLREARPPRVSAGMNVDERRQVSGSVVVEMGHGGAESLVIHVTFSRAQLRRCRHEPPCTLTHSI